MLSRVRREYAAGSKPFSSGRGSSRLVVPLSFASCNAARLESRRDRFLASLAEPTLGLRSKFNLRLVLDSDSPIPSALRECSHSPTSPVKRGSGIDLTFADSGEIGQTSGVHLGGAVVLSKQRQDSRIRREGQCPKRERCPGSRKSWLWLPFSEPGSVKSISPGFPSACFWRNGVTPKTKLSSQSQSRRHKYDVLLHTWPLLGAAE